MQRGRLTLDPQLFQDQLEFSLELSSTVATDGADLVACGVDVFRDEFAKLLHSLAFMYEEAIEAEKVIHAKHHVPVVAKINRMKGTCDVDKESLRALISAAFGRFCYGVTSHPGLRALHTWAPRSR